ncbi:MAG: SIS domain-containing protein [Chlamydiia bacterium]|nr:SIS domain-containing protein [Chlamydiia bacterium]
MVARQQLLQSVKQCIAAVSKLETEGALTFMEQVAKALEVCFRLHNKVLIAGNGGSLCDAMHFAEELTGFFREKREALPAIALSDPGHMSCVGNDLGFEWVFARHIEALGQPGDLFIGLSTSGNSVNLVRAFQAAQQKKMTTIAFLGKEGGALKGVADFEWIVEGFATSDRIQEAHMAAAHLVIELLEARLFQHVHQTV